jgi:hypothetical protein
VTSARADFVVIETHLSLERKTIEHFKSMRLAVPVAVPRSAADIGEQSSRSSDLGYLEGDITDVADDLRADLAEL